MSRPVSTAASARRARVASASCSPVTRAPGGNALRIRADVTDFEQVSAAVDRMRRDYGGVQVLICAAGVPGPIGVLAEQSAKALAETKDRDLHELQPSEPTRLVRQVRSSSRAGGINGWW